MTLTALINISFLPSQHKWSNEDAPPISDRLLYQVFFLKKAVLQVESDVIGVAFTQLKSCLRFLVPRSDSRCGPDSALQTLVSQELYRPVTVGETDVSHVQNGHLETLRIDHRGATVGRRRKRRLG